MIDPTSLVLDEYHGIGGEYILDPETGKRSPVTTEPTAKPEELTNGPVRQKANNPN